MSSEKKHITTSANALQEELSRSRAAFQTLIAHAPFGAQRYALQADGCLKLIEENDAAMLILGAGGARTKGLRIEEAFPALAETLVPSMCRKVAAEGGLFEDNHVACTVSGVSEVYEIHALQPEPRHVALLFRDVTERVHMEEELSEREKRLASIFRAAPIGIGMAADRVIMEANEKLCIMTGYSRKELLGADTRRFYADEAEFERVGRVLGTKESSTGHGSVETRWVRKDGTSMDVLMGTSPLVQGDLHAGVTFTVLDITERRREMEERQALEARMLQAQKMESLGVLAGGIAHDFNNILMIVLGNADLAMMHQGVPSPVRESIAEIEKASRRAAKLCRQMLDYSGKGTFSIQRLGLNEIVRDMENMVSVSVSKRATVRLALGRDVPAVAADAIQIRQVIMALVTNASEAIGEEDGTITVATGAMRCERAYLRAICLDEELQEGRFAFIEVSDNGAGMDSATRERIFEPFFTTKFAGRGLGLAAVLGIVRGHKGAIKVYSEPGRGTTFKVLFPVAQETEATDEAFPCARWTGKGAVILADDEEGVREVGRRMLESLGFEVLPAQDGKEAIEIFQSHREAVSCVILDLTMPRVDGEEAFREIRRIDPGVHVLLSSGYNEQDAIQKFVGKGLAGFLQKPYQLSMLAERMREVIGEPV